MARLGTARLGVVGSVRVRLVKVGYGLAGLASYGRARHVVVGHGSAGRVWLGVVVLGGAWLCVAGEVRRVMLSRVMACPGRHGRPIKRKKEGN